MKEHSTKYFIIVSVVKYILGIVAVVVDLRFFDLPLDLNKLVEIMFSSILVLSGIWVSSYLLLVELYKDRYQFNVIKDELLPIMKNKLIEIVCLVIFGVFILIVGRCFLSAIYYTILSTIIIAKIFPGK